MKTPLLLAFAATTALAGAALAQTPAPALVELPDTANVAALGMTVDQIDDMDVHDAQGKDVGEVGEIYGATADAATHLAIDFDDDGGSPFADRDDVLVPIENVSVSNGRLVVNLTPEQVAALPTHDD